MAPVETEPSFRPPTPTALADLALLSNAQGREWDMAPDGERFVSWRDLSGEVAAGTEGLVFVLNWFEELQARVPTGR